MSLTPEELEDVSEAVLQLYMAIENELLINMATVLNQDRELILVADDGTEYEQWRIRQLNKIGGINEDNLKIIAKYAKQSPKEVEKMLKEASKIAIDHIEPTLEEALQLGLLSANVGPPNKSLALLNILQQYERQAINTLNLVNSTMLSQADQIYLDIINTTTAKVLTGVITPEVALRQAVKQWTDNGVPALIAKNGARWSTESYVYMVTRTVSNNTANNMQFERMNEYGSDLIEISSHVGARELCFPYQGKIYSRSGIDKQFPPFSSTSYGQPAGILGINCGHVIYPYVRGLSTKRNDPVNKKENDRVYENQQKQRKLERLIRQAKREVEVMKALGDPVGVAEAQERLKLRQANMRAFIKATGRKRKPSREQIS